MNMKKLTFLAVMLVCSLMAFSQAKTVAITDIVDRTSKLTYEQKLMLRSALAKAVTNMPGYEAYDRSDMDILLSEHEFQRTGYVSDDQIKKITEMTGAAYILITEAVAQKKNVLGMEVVHFFVTSKILNVETRKYDRTEQQKMGTNLEDILRGCDKLAVKLFGNNLTSTSTIVEQPQPAPVVQQPVAVVEKDVVYSKKKEPAPLVIRTGKEYSYKGNYLTEQDYENLLRNTCPEAFAQYSKGEKLIKAGWGMFIPGVILLGGGIAMGITGGNMYYPEMTEEIYDEYGNLLYSHSNLSAEDERYNRIGNALEVGGTVSVAIGGIMTVTSIPILSVGYVKRNKRALKTFNQRCAESAVNYNLTLGQNGLGLAINF